MRDPNSTSDLSSSIAVSIKDLSTILSSSDHVYKQTKNFKDKENERIIPVSAKEFQMIIQRNYPYKAVVQCP